MTKHEIKTDLFFQIRFDFVLFGFIQAYLWIFGLKTARRHLIDKQVNDRFQSAQIANLGRLTSSHKCSHTSKFIPFFTSIVHLLRVVILSNV